VKAVMPERYPQTRPFLHTFGRWCVGSASVAVRGELAWLLAAQPLA
jgi:hypothetical protein